MGNAPEFGVDIRRQVSTTRIPAVSRAELGRPAFLPWDRRHENPAASPPAAGSAPRAFCPGPVSAALFSPVRESHDPDAHPSRSSGKLSCAQTQLQQAVPHIPVLSALPACPLPLPNPHQPVLGAGLARGPGCVGRPTPARRAALAAGALSSPALLGAPRSLISLTFIFPFGAEAHRSCGTH